MKKLLSILGLIFFVCAANSQRSVCLGVADNTIISDGIKCSGWILCFRNEIVRTGNCPYPFLFNKKNQLCDFPFNVNCNLDEIQTTELAPTTEETTTEIETTTELDLNIYCPVGKLLLVEHPKICSQFIICFDGYAILRDCAEGLHFDPVAGECNFPEIAGCQLCPPTNDPNNIVILPSEVDCRIYYVCFNGEPRQVVCPEGLYFNVDIEACDLASNVNCTVPNLSQDVVTVTSVACPKYGYSFIAHPDSCSYYFTCFDGQSSMRKCPPGLAYSKRSASCTLRSKSECISKNFSDNWWF